jgi:thioredoxin-related protein
MEKKYRIIYQSYEGGSQNKVLSEEILMDGDIKIPTNCYDLSMEFQEQIGLIQKAQDCLINDKAMVINSSSKECPSCAKKLTKFGKHKSVLHDVLTDHKLSIRRLRCRGCGHEEPSTVQKIINTDETGDLQRIQSVLGSKFTYRGGKKIMSLFSMKNRRVNNHERIKSVTDTVGKGVSDILEAEKDVLKVQESKTLILAVDGGHVKTTEEGKRSIEAMTSVVYRPESIETNKSDTHNHLTSKNCAASVKDDNQEEIISGTIIAALKQGLTSKTHIHALCDGAKNCWNVVESLRGFCGEMTCILDWFHITMKMQNISLPGDIKKVILESVKWHLWRGNSEEAIKKLDELAAQKLDAKNKDKIIKFKNYISNNADKIVNYDLRKKEGLIFTSNLAESTVESLINQRCKGHQHMRWSREGLNPVLQLRAAINNQCDWESKIKTAILNAA